MMEGRNEDCVLCQAKTLFGRRRGCSLVELLSKGRIKRIALMEVVVIKKAKEEEANGTAAAAIATAMNINFPHRLLAEQRTSRQENV